MHNSLFPLFGLSRLRMQTDGAGVTTLVAAQGCPLRCRMCINPLALNENARAEMVSPEVKSTPTVLASGTSFLSSSICADTGFISEVPDTL